MDTPDPYIYMCIRTAPEGRKQTTVKDNEINPVWNETFTFLLDEAVENIMGKQDKINFLSTNDGFLKGLTLNLCAFQNLIITEYF